MMDAPWQCSECGRDVNDPSSEELRELVERWRAYAEQNDDWALEQCWNDAADELEAVLDE